MIWRLLRIPPRLAYACGLGSLLGRFVLLLTTTGRKTGRKRVTPLQYEVIDGCYYVAAARGTRSDWLMNLEAHPRALVRVGTLRLTCTADVIHDEEQVADYLALRLENQPRMMSAIMRAAGAPASPDRHQLKTYAAARSLVRLEPDPTYSDVSGRRPISIFPSKDASQLPGAERLPS